MVFNGFKKFTGTERSSKPKISIRTNGQITFNAVAIERFKIDSYEFAIMYYNENLNKIAIQFTNDGSTEGAIKIVKRRNNYFIPEKTFLDFNSIDYSETKEFDVDWTESKRAAVVCV